MPVSKNPLNQTTGQEPKEAVDPFAELDAASDQTPEVPTTPEVSEPAPATPEIPKPPEAEKVVEQEPGEPGKEVTAKEEKKAKPTTAPAKQEPAAQAAVPQKSATQEEIEGILQADLEEIYQQMDEEHKVLFKEKGEETASKITELVESAKATAKKVVGLIVDWLKVIPGVNKFFLEQEAKIKADKILGLATKEEETEK